MNGLLDPASPPDAAGTELGEKLGDRSIPSNPLWKLNRVYVSKYNRTLRENKRPFSFVMMF